MAHCFAVKALNADEAAKFSAHLKDCRECQQEVFDHWSADILAQIELDPKLGRYTIEEQLGSGGGGIVFRAKESKLGREVALKLFPSLGCDARSRREAQMMARETHPNIIAVYETGAFDERTVYISMELFKGAQPLESWLPERQAALGRRIRHTRLLDALRNLGAGLEAVHKAGVVHNDIKPSNVLVVPQGEDSFTLKVADFGVSLPLPGSQQRISGPRGTPGWMPPEVHDKTQPPDPRRDVWGFSGLVLWALSVHGSSSKDDEAAKEVPMRQLRKVPRWLRGILQTGLANSPKDRFSSMKEMLNHMDHARKRRSALVRTLSIATLVLGMAVAGAGWTMLSKPSCDWTAWGPDEAWGSGNQGRVRDAFLASGAQGSEDTFERVSTIISDYIDTWTASANKVCSAGGQQVFYDEKIACLERLRNDVRFIVNSFGAADIKTVQRSINAAAKLDDPRSCLHVSPSEQLKNAASTGERLAELLHERNVYFDIIQRLGEITVKRHLGQLNDADALAGELFTEALRAQQWEAAAHAGIERLEVKYRLREYEQLKALCSLVARVAFRANLPDAVAKATEMELWVADRSLEDFRTGDDIATVLISLLEEPEGIRLETRTAALMTLASYHSKRGRYTEAVERAEEALRLRRERFGAEHHMIAVALQNLGYLLRKAERFEEAVEVNRSAASMFERTLGVQNSRTVAAYTSVGVALLELNHVDRAAEALEKALHLGDQLPERGPMPGLVRTRLGEIAFTQGRYDESERLNSEALQLFREKNQHENTNAMIARIGLARVFAYNGDCTSALAELRTATSVLRSKRAASHLLAQAFFERAKCTGDRALAEEALMELPTTVTGSQKRTRGAVLDWLRTQD